MHIPSSVMAFVIVPLVGALANWMLWWDTAEHWTAFVAAHPKRASAVRVLRAIFPHVRKALQSWRSSQSGRAALPVLVAVATAYGVAGVVGLALAGCPHPPPPASDASVSTPRGWTDTARTVLRAIAWSIPAARVVVDAAVQEPQRTMVDRSLASVSEAARGLETAVDAYEARGGDRCAASAAVAGLTDAFVVLAQVLADNGIALGTTLSPIVQSLGAVADMLVPMCQRDAAYASVGDATSRRLHAVEVVAMTHGRTLRPLLDGLRP